MEINTQQMEVLLQLQEQQAQLPRKSCGKPAQGFDALFNEQLAIGQNDPTRNLQAAGDAQPLLYSQMLLNSSEIAQKQNSDLSALQAAFDQTSGALDLWDAYTSILGSSTADSSLRDAYSLLEGIDSRVSQLKNNTTIGNDTELNGIVNELEILTAIEKFKFNRGDYLS